MKTFELIDLLKRFDSETEIRFEFGSDDDYRLACARLIAEQPLDIDWRQSVSPMLEHLAVSNIVWNMGRKEIIITFEQDLVDVEDEISNVKRLRSELKKGGES